MSRQSARSRLALAIGSWRVRREGWEQAEEPHPFWDRVVLWLVRGDFAET